MTAVFIAVDFIIVISSFFKNCSGSPYSYIAA